MDAAFENEINRLVAATKDKCVYAWLLSFFGNARGLKWWIC